MKLVKTIGEYANINDFSVFFKDDGKLKDGIMFKILSFKTNIYQKEEDKYIIQTKNLILRNHKIGQNIAIDNFYLITFDANKNVQSEKYEKIEVWKE